MEKKLSEIKWALVSVSDKTGVAEFLKPLVKSGLKVVSTGGTAKHLKDHGIEVIDVSDHTGFPEVMDGRVKTLHPKVHMCLLAREHVAEDLQLLKDYNIQPFDMVIGNLYPFERATAQSLSARELAEYIDIGGPSFLRAAAKSFERITVICNPEDYARLEKKGSVSVDDRKFLAAKVFSHVASYDAMVAQQLGISMDNSELALGGNFVQPLRYGENPQQQASWFSLKATPHGLHAAEILQGKPLSYNNLLDLDASVSTLREFAGTACVAVKHLNPCGVSMGSSVAEAVDQAIKADPVSVFGGIIAINKKVDDLTAEIISKGFIECVVAPDFSKEAMQILSQKKNLRVLKWSAMCEQDKHDKVRSVSGGVLVQSQDLVSSWSADWKLYGETPSEKIKSSIEFSWKVCAHLKSNAIAVISGQQTVGLGMGQVNRVDAVEQALSRVKKFHPQANELVLASDAFFPFADSIEIAAQHGVKWVVQPGGSIRDEEVIAKASEFGVNLVLTGQRHFQH